MGSKSILELEEARRRLQQMTQDHQDLAELISKLKAMRDSLVEALESARAKLQQTGEQAKRAEETLASLTRAFADFRQESEGTLADVYSTGVKVEAKLNKLVGETHKQIEGMLGTVHSASAELNSRFAAWAAEQQRGFEDFGKQQQAALTRVKDAYDRARVTLESHGPLIDRLDEKVDKLIEKHGEAIASLRDRIDDMAERGEHGIAKLQDSLRTVREDAETGLESVARGLRDELRQRVDEVNKAQTQTAADLRVVQRRLRLVRFTMWLILLAAAGAIALLARVL